MPFGEQIFNCLVNVFAARVFRILATEFCDIFLVDGGESDENGLSICCLVHDSVTERRVVLDC
jgi:hypothetical protein